MRAVCTCVRISATMPCEDTQYTRYCVIIHPILGSSIYPILLHQLYSIGINGKLWRLLKDWYCGLSGCVRLNGHKSREFPVMRGIRQRSVLSPILFLMVMDPLLQQLEKSALGPSVNDLYVGGFLHADDIHTLASSLDVLDAQVLLVQKKTSTPES